MGAMFKSSRGDVDPVSGNDVPTGSLPEEVRDDIPAQLSEGEYVVPADVVRYYGVKFFEDLRGEAKMGWQAMEQSGRIGGEPMSPPGMEMGDDELPFDLSELNFVEVSDDAINGMAEGGFWAGLKRAFGADERPSTKEIMERRAKERESSSGNDRDAERSKRSSREDSKRDSGPSIAEQINFGGDYDKPQRSQAPVTEPTRKAYTGSPSDVRKQRSEEKGVNLLENKPDAWGNLTKALGFADGGYALSEGDPGYEDQGALGFGKEGLPLGGGVVMRLYRNDAGDEIEIPFLNGEPQVEIPEGYYPVSASESVLPSEDTTVSGGTGGGGGGGIAPAQAQAINYKELSTAELQKMVKEQQGYTGDAIAAGLGLLNPLLGVAVKLAMWDSAKRVEAELERRAGLPDLSPEEKTSIQETLLLAKKEKPTLMKKIFGKVKDKVLDVVDPQEPMSVGPSTRRGPERLTPEERLMQQGVLPFDTTEAQGAPTQSEITTEELPPAGLEGVSDAIDAAKDTVYTSEKYNTAGQGSSPTPMTDAFGTGNIFTSGTKASPVGSVYTPQSTKEDTTDYDSVRKAAKATSSAMIQAAKKDLATEDEVKTMQNAAQRVDNFLADKASGRNTSGQVGFKEGGLASRKKKKK